MLNIESIKNSSYSDIVANVDNYIKIFLAKRLSLQVAQGYPSVSSSLD
jgi:hypothetical protein